MNWDIKEIHNYNEYMQKYSIHSLLAKIFAQREYNEQDVQGHTSKRLIYHDFSLFSEAELTLERINEAIANKEIGILLLTEKFGREFPQIVDDVKLNHKTPLIIEIPDRHGTGRKPDFITGYVNEAIGLKL